MNDRELDQLLRKVKVPKRGKQYEKAFTKKVSAAVRQQTHTIKPKNNRKSL